MSNPEQGCVIAHAIPVADIPEEGIAGRIEASREERLDLAGRLDLGTLDRLELNYTLQPMSRGRFCLTGAWAAAATQVCGVTLEPIALDLGETVSVEFWPEHTWERHWRNAGEIAVAPDQDMPERIQDGVIDPGRLLEELLTVALPPFPRHESAELEWREAGNPPESPFAVLKNLPQRNGRMD